MSLGLLRASNKYPTAKAHSRCHPSIRCGARLYLSFFFFFFLLLRLSSLYCSEFVRYDSTAYNDVCFIGVLSLVSPIVA